MKEEDKMLDCDTQKYTQTKVW